MHFAKRQVGNCALCAFRSPEWELFTTIARGGKRRYRQRTPSPPIRRVAGGGFEPNSPRGEPIIRTPTDFGTRSLFSREDVKYSLFVKLVLQQFAILKHQYAQPERHPELLGWGIKTKKSFKTFVRQFQHELTRCCADSVARRGKSNDPPPLFQKLHDAFVTGDVKGLAARLKHEFATFVLDQGFTKEEIENHRKLVDFRYPLEWFPETRAMQRKVHLHVGPTNSGKTYQALKRLEGAKSGLYAGPLRLLAHEVYTRLNAKGRSCSLVTGEERRVPEGQESFLSSCTVEMVPLNTTVDVAVIDEIQMLGDPERGWAWTQALLGVRAKEIHLCGELRTIPLIQDFCAATGDSLEIHTYERLSPLKTMDTSLKGDLRKLQKGDAVILFSRVAIHSMKKEIEKVTGRRCAVVYGSLPPETRAQQANLFNDPNNDYDFLAASDAVGMGLNLSIKRIIFEATSKHDGSAYRAIEIPEMKQIAGRAGRYRTAAQGLVDNVTPEIPATPEKQTLQLDIGQNQRQKTMGLVTTLEDFDLPILQRAMSTEVEPLMSAGIQAPPLILARFAGYFPANTPFSYIIQRLYELATIHPRYHFCRLKDQIAIADAVQQFDLTVYDRIIFSVAPANFRDEGMEEVVKALAKCVADQSGGHLLNIKEINLELLDQPPDTDGKEYLRKLEALHKALTLYLWLSYRFAGVFRSQPLAFHVKSLVEEKIDTCLAQVQLDLEKRKRIKVLRENFIKSEMKRAKSQNEKTTGENINDTPIALYSSWTEDRQRKVLADMTSEVEAQRESTVH